jgi:hypothetical protein
LHLLVGADAGGAGVDEPLPLFGGDVRKLVE